MTAGWELVDVSGWIWFIVAIPEILLVGAIAARRPQNRGNHVIFVVLAANLCGLALLIARSSRRAAATSRAGSSS